MKKGKAGILVRPENADDLATAITWAVKHQNDWRRMGGNGRKVYEKYFSHYYL